MTIGKAIGLFKNSQLSGRKDEQLSEYWLTKVKDGKRNPLAIFSAARRSFHNGNGSNERSQLDRSDCDLLSWFCNDDGAASRESFANIYQEAKTTTANQDWFAHAVNDHFALARAGAHSVLAANCFVAGDLNGFFVHANNSVRLFHQAWGLDNQQKAVELPESWEFFSHATGCKTELAIRAWIENSTNGSHDSTVRPELNISNVLLMQKTLSYLWKEEDKVLKPLNSNVARVNLVNEATGSGIPNLITISAVDQSLFGFYIDPIETGLVALDEPMKTSLGLAWAVCQNDLLRWANKPNKSKASMNTRLGLVWEFCRHGFPGWARNSKKSKITSTNPVVLPAIRLNLPIGSLRLTGDSASGMIAVAMLVTASGGTLDTDRTCSFAIRLNKRKES